MKWRVDAWWPNGVRWELVTKKTVEGRVFRIAGGEVEVCSFGADSEHTRFSTMKEAAEWLVKKVTTGTGAQ